MIKIALDAGHGLGTPGKQTPDGIKEWTLNDRVRDKVVEFLKDYEVEALHTDNNEGNVDESLSSRLSAYKKAGVAAVVSMHHNALNGNWNNANGVEVYVDKNATADDLRLAELIYNKLVEYTGLKGRGIKRANFAVINQNSIPAVLVEGGFMDNKGDYAVITSDKGQTAYAKAVAEGLIEFLNLKKKEVELMEKECKFTDISGHFAEKDIKDLFTMGVVNGKDETHYEPNAPVTRGEVAVIARNIIRYIMGK